MTSFIAELKRRRVFRAGGVYIVAGWVVIQVAATVLPVFDLPAWTTRAVVIVVATGFPVVLVLPWVYDVSSRGLRRALVAGGAGVVALAGLGFAVLATSRRLDSLPPLMPGKATHITTAAGLELDPALSPDGRTVAYAAGAPGRMRIYVQSVAGGQAVPLAETLDEHQRSPQWSPDGARLAFHTGAQELELGPGAPSSAIYAVPALGGVPRALSAPTSPGFSAAWSPDGRQIAYMPGNGVYGKEIWIMPADGGAARKLVDAPDGYGLRWSPDGSMLAYATGNPRFTLGSAHLANDGPSAIWTVTIADGRAHRITTGDAIHVSPVWTPDSRALLFISNRDGVRDVYRARVRRDGTAQGAPERITTGLNAHGIDLSADGASLAYSTYTAYSHIWWVQIPTTGAARLADATQVTFGNETLEGLALSPDGKWLAYDSDRSGNGDIWKVSVEGGTPQQLTIHPAGDYVQDFSPDGRELAYHAVRDGIRRIFVVHADGTGVQQVTSGASQDVNPDFAPDGNTIAYNAWRSASTGDDDLGIFTISRPGAGEPWGAPRPIIPHGSDAAWSPDGDWIAYVHEGALHLYAPRTGETRTLIAARDDVVRAEPQFAYWAPDARTVYFKAFDDERHSSIWSVPAAGGTPRLLLRLDDPARPSLRREFATDGKRLYFMLARPEADVWVMELRTK